jgi:FkbM family methyltransferase
VLSRLKRRLRARLRAGTRRTLTVAGNTIGFFADDPAGARLAKWSPDWKTDLIGRILSRRPGTFLDVGANVGQTLLDYLASNTSGGYIGFEPNPRAAVHLGDLIRNNGLRDCSIVPAALSSRSGISTLYSIEGRPIDGSATIVSDLRPGRSLVAERIACYRLDDIQADLLDDRKVSLTKIDVEGAENRVIEGMVRFLARRPWIICEILGRDSRAAPADHMRRMTELMRMLRDGGYGAFRIEKHPGNAKVLGFTAVDAFPDIVWTTENQHDFDYLLIPADEKAQLEALI